MTAEDEFRRFSQLLLLTGLALILGLLLSGCTPKGCHRESGMFGVFGQKYWEGYVCPKPKEEVE